MVSFDLFDTLLRRRHLKVNEVHDTVSAYVLACCGRRVTGNPFHLTLLRYQVSDALKSFDGTGTQEPLLADVWARVLPSICDDASQWAQIAQAAVAFELGIERANLALIDGAEDLLRRLRADRKRVIAISDMYFDKPMIEGILSHLGILDLFDYVYVSAQSRLTKQTGDLFRLMLDQSADVHLHSAVLGASLGTFFMALHKYRYISYVKPALAVSATLHYQYI